MTYLDDLEDGLDSKLDEARAHIHKVETQIAAYIAALEDLEEGVDGMRPPKIEINHWVLLAPFMQEARLASARKALRIKKRDDERLAEHEARQQENR